MVRNSVGHILNIGPSTRRKALIRVGEFTRQRERMVDTQIASRGIRDPWVLHAMRTVPREAFVPASLQESAYDDGPLPIGDDQTISQPYVVAAMTEVVQPKPGNRALEIGTPSSGSDLWRRLPSGPWRISAIAMSTCFTVTAPWAG